MYYNNKYLELMKKLYSLLIAFLLTSSSLFSQGRLDYSSKWFIGFNVGGTWQTTDVKNPLKMGTGYGLTLGKSFNYDYGRRISFDFRARYLYGNWSGQNVDSTSINSNYSGALSQFGSNYKDSLGYSVNNFQTEVHRFAFELVLHANGIKERTNWDPYIFGGIGATFHKTYGNLTNTNGLYGYDNLTTFNNSTVTSLLDKSYETPLDGTTANTFRVNFMPSLGFGLGYQISKRVSIGIEHKTTFTLIDDFDGVVSASKYNDIYHYTGGYIKFRLRSGSESHRIEEDKVVIPPTPITTVPSTPQLPVVKFVNPSVTGQIVSSAAYSLLADVNFVDGRNNIVFKQEGVENSNFTYNATTDRLENSVILKLGENVFEIKGTNAFGSDIKSTIVIYKRNEGTPPIVIITNPSTASITVTNPVYNLTSTILNVQTSSQVSKVFNGQNNTNFTFNPTTNILTSTLALVEGTNTITIKGTNTFGSDSKTVTIIYNKPVVNVPVPPVVTFITPNVDPFTSLTSQCTISATVLHVTLASGVVVNMNGTNIPNFQFNGPSSTVSFAANLIEGTNIITITGTNTAGVDSETQTIIYQKPVVVLPPVVTYINPPTSGLEVSDETFNLIANITNVEFISQVTVSKNGQNINPSFFTFDSSTKKVSLNTVLNFGNNTFSVSGTNSAGTSSETTTIFYRKIVAPCEPPTITIKSPIALETAVSTIVFSAFLENIISLSQIHFVLNGLDITDGSFNATTKIFTKSVSLKEGVNIFNIAVVNECGSTKAQANITYVPYVAPCLPPTITIKSPLAVETAVSSNVFSALLENITSLSQIHFVLNGLDITDGSFNATTKIFTKSVTLKEGVNIFNIAVVNDCGSTKDQKNCTFVPPTGTVLPSKGTKPTGTTIIPIPEGGKTIPPPAIVPPASPTPKGRGGR